MLRIHPNELWHYDCWVDADFAGNWQQRDAHVDLMTSKSRSGWLVRFPGITHHMGLQNGHNNSNVYYRGGVHRPLHQPKGGYTHDGDAPGGKGARASSRLPTSKGALHRIQG